MESTASLEARELCIATLTETLTEKVKDAVHTLEHIEFRTGETGQELQIDEGKLYMVNHELTLKSKNCGGPKMNSATRQ